MQEFAKHVCGVCRLRARALVDRVLGRAARRRCVLVVDDMPDVADLARFLLEGAGYEVHGAEDGVEGLRRARELRPDVMLLNYLMPRMDGLETLKSLKRDPILRNIRVVVHSVCAASPRFREEAVAVGALDCLAVPFEPKVLLAKVERALNG